MSEVVQGSIQIWRQKSLDGTITLDEMRQAIAAIRKERVQASEKSAVSRASKAKASWIDGDALLQGFMGM
jgi:hypothetical protein